MEYDLIIIGGGPDGLAIGAYMAKAGMKCLLVERNNEPGGSFITEDFGGFRFNIASQYIPRVDPAPVRDLELEKNGYRVYRPENQLRMAYGSRSIALYMDEKKTSKDIGKRSPKDAEAFLRLYNLAREINESIIIPWVQSPPPNPAFESERLERSSLGKVLLEMGRMSPLEIVRDSGIEDDWLSATLIYVGCRSGISPRSKGTGRAFLSNLHLMSGAGIVAGGSRLLPSSILTAYYRWGGDLLRDTEVRRVIVKEGMAEAIETDSGKIIGAKAVVSTLNPKQTFLELISTDLLPKDLVRKVEAWKWDGWSSFSVHLGVKGNPLYQDANGRISGALMNIIGYDGLEQVLDHWDRCSDGKLPVVESLWTTTSCIDPTQAPDGLHTIRMETQVPFDLKKGEWCDAKKTLADSCVEEWRRNLANPDQVKIIKQYPYPPSYLEARLPELSKGSLNEGALVPEQMGYFRPHESCSGSRTPIKGYYVAGKAVHSGSHVMLSTALLTVNAIAEDLNIEKWWANKH